MKTRAVFAAPSDARWIRQRSQQCRRPGAMQHRGYLSSQARTSDASPVMSWQGRCLTERGTRDMLPTTLMCQVQRCRLMGRLRTIRESNMSDSDQVVHAQLPVVGQCIVEPGESRLEGEEVLRPEAQVLHGLRPGGRAAGQSEQDGGRQQHGSRKGTRAGRAESLREIA